MCIHPSKTIVTTRVEHHAVLQTCQALKREGVQIRFCEVDDKGVVSKCAPEVLCGAGLVSVMLANNEIGSIEPVREIAAAAHTAGALVHTDAVQAVGHIPVHVDVLGVDFLSASAHKFNGPKGIGFLFARDPSSLRPLLYGGGQEHGMRSGTENVPAIAGMAAALQAHNAAMGKNTLHLQKLERVTKRKPPTSFVRSACQNSWRKGLCASLTGTKTPKKKRCNWQRRSWRATVSLSGDLCRSCVPKYWAACRGKRWGVIAGRQVQNYQRFVCAEGSSLSWFVPVNKYAVLAATLDGCSKQGGGNGPAVRLPAGAAAIMMAEKSKHRKDR